MSDRPVRVSLDVIRCVDCGAVEVRTTQHGGSNDGFYLSVCLTKNQVGEFIRAVIDVESDDAKEIYEG